MLQVKTEYGRLKKVLMASVETFHLHDPINLTQKYYYANNPPKHDILLYEQEMFVNVLKKNDVEIVWADKRMDCTNQLNTRDVAFVIDDVFVVSKMREKERENEHLALETLISSIKNNVLKVDAGCIEGGDILLDNKRIYVGISQRTDLSGYDWLQKNFSNSFEIVPIKLSKGYLHLDCVFNLISNQEAMVLEDGILPESLNLISKQKTLIKVYPEEQINLPTNIFSIDPATVVADIRNKKTNSMLKKVGKKVIEIDFTETNKIGGSFRCSTCPLWRDIVNE